ncbi:MAG: MFS transporter [Streptosporangiaceae bacterium]
MTPAASAPAGRPDAGHLTVPGGPADQAQSQSPRGRAAAGFWIVGYLFAATMAFTTLPAPLYVLYQARDHFGSAMVTVIFAAYAAGVVVSLLTVGHVSDWLGRRPMVAVAVAINMAAGLLFLAWPTVPGLLVGRVVSGVSAGLLTATATAFLADLHGAARPGAPQARAEAVAAAVNLGGLGAGALLAGILAAYAALPLALPYLVSEGLMIAGAIALVLVPETVARPEHRPRYRPQRVRVPAGQRSLFYAAGLAAAVTFALFGLFTSLAPGFLSGTLHQPSHALAGAATFVVFGAAAAAQIWVGRLPVSPGRQAVLGLSALAAGLAAVTAAVWLSSLALFLVGGAIAGAGAGAAFKNSIATALAIAPEGARGETLAALFVAAYLGLTVPVVGLGVATQMLSTRAAVLGFAAVLIAVAGLVSRRLATQRS